MQSDSAKRRTRTVEFWPGSIAEIDLDLLERAAISVKGVACDAPTRFLDIFTGDAIPRRKAGGGGVEMATPYPWPLVVDTFLPRIDSHPIAIHDGVPQPPFCWGDAEAKELALSFTYNTNAFYRVLRMLADQGTLASHDVPQCLDAACLVLTRIYRSRDNFLMKNMNNNLNMFFISKVLEHILGSDVYDAERQEVVTTHHALVQALRLAEDYARLPLHEKMAVAILQGVSFFESRLSGAALPPRAAGDVLESSYRYFGRPLRIDHRTEFLDAIERGGLSGAPFRLVTIFDDATETVYDLLWLDELMVRYPFLEVNALINTAQISINVSSAMLPTILASPVFRGLATRLGRQFSVTEIYCPFISFQTNYLPQAARQAIDRANVVLVKGANFFETCQLPDQDVFHAFVVFGPVSRAHAGLDDFDGVFAHVPPGLSGYERRRGYRPVVPLLDIVRRQASDGAHGSTRISQ